MNQKVDINGSDSATLIEHWTEVVALFPNVKEAQPTIDIVGLLANALKDLGKFMKTPTFQSTLAGMPALIKKFADVIGRSEDSVHYLHFLAVELIRKDWNHDFSMGAFSSDLTESLICQQKKIARASARGGGRISNWVPIGLHIVHT